MTKGLFITFEGPDGSGKTTQIELLKEYLNSKGFEVIYTREPGGTIISEKIREIILDNKNNNMSDICEALLYAAARAQLVNELIKPSIEQGKIVICDRFVHSSIVYQGIARGLGVDKIDAINNAATEGIEPDLIFMMNISYQEGLIRKSKQKQLDRLENSGDSFHKKVYDGYIEISKTYEDIINIDANRSKEAIQEDIISILREKLLGN